MLKIEHFILLLPFFIALFWFVIITISVFKENRRKIALSFFMLSGIVSLYSGILFIDGNYVIYRKLYIVSVFLALSQFPAFYHYIVSLTSETPIKKRFYFIHFIVPLVATLVAVYIHEYWLSNFEKIFFIEEILTGNSPIEGKYKLAFYIDKGYKLIFITFAIYYYYQTNNRIEQHKKSILDYFSNTETVNVNWFNIFRAAFFLTLFSGILFHSFDRSIHLQNPWMPLVSYTFLSFFYWVVGYFGNRQIDIYKSVNKKQVIINNADLTNVAIEKVKLDDIKAEEIAKKIEDVLNKDKLFLKPDLTLPEVARATGTNRSYLSLVINDYMNLNFNKYINQKRVEYAKNILSLDEIVPSKDLAYTCGFNSQATFYRVFKEFTGETPTKYRNRILLSEGELV